jgi:hypothetical protein
MYDITIEKLPDPQYKLIERKPSISFKDILTNSYNHDPNAFIKNGFFMDKELSDKYSQVYVRPSRKKLIVSTAGTRPHEGVDLVTDAFSIAGVKLPRYSHSKNILEKAKVKYNIKRAHLFGHSLGHMVSSHIAEPHDEVRGYNGAWGAKTKSKHYTHIKHEGDILTVLLPANEVVPHKGIKSLDLHSIPNMPKKYAERDIFRLHNEL